MRETSKTTVVGAAPEGTADPHSAARAVREMFTSIAPRYDLLNHLLSFNVDRMWWRRTARAFRHILARPEARILDLCCGTGDMTFALRRQAGKSSPQILGADFSHAMLQLAAAKSSSAAQNGASPGWIEADALCLPFPSADFDLITSAFGFRNLTDYDAGIERDRPSAAAWGRVRHSRLWRAQRRDGHALPRLFQASATPRRYHDIRRPRPLRLSSRLRRAFSRARRNAR